MIIFDEILQEVFISKEVINKYFNSISVIETINMNRKVLMPR